MSALAPIDLNPYGLGWTLDPTKSVVVPQDYRTSIVSKSLMGNTLKFTKPDGKSVSIVLNRTVLASGTFGSTFTTDTELEPGIKLVVKLIARSDQYTTVDVITESIVNIILYEVSKDVVHPEVAGPFVPKLYLFGKDNNYYYLVLERLETKWLDDIKATNNPQTLVQPLLQVTQILKTLYERLRFNHRDFKPDNIMYKTVAGKKQFRLIDFGMSCLNYGKIHVEPTNSYITSSNGLRTCFSPSRDLSALMLYILDYTHIGQTGCGLLRILKILLMDEVKAPHPEGNNAWANSYKFYNRSPPNINVDPETLYNIFKSITYVNPASPCSEIFGTWTKNLKYITFPMTKYFTDEELINVPIPALLDLLLNKINGSSAMGARLIKRVYDLAQTIGVSELTNAINKSKGVKLGKPPAAPVPTRHTLAPGPRLGIALPQLKKAASPSIEQRLLELAEAKWDSPKLKELILNPALNISYTDSTGRNVLHYLAKYESTEYLDLIFAKNSTSEFINAEDMDGTCPLAYSIDSKIYRNAAKFLSLPNIDVFHKASYTHNHILDKLIIDGKVDFVNRVLEINNSAEFINYDAGNYNTPISHAIYIEHVAIVNILVSHPNFIAPKNIHYLLTGVKSSAIIAKFISDIDLYEPDYVNFIEPKTGNTPLILACRLGNLLMVKTLLRSRFILTAVRNLRGETALHTAAEFCRETYAPNMKEEELFDTAGGQIIRLLLDKNSALPNIPSQTGVKPSSPEYSGEGTLKKFLKMKKSTVFKRHINSNINTRKAINTYIKNPIQRHKNPLVFGAGRSKTRRIKQQPPKHYAFSESYN